MAAFERSIVHRSSSRTAQSNSLRAKFIVNRTSAFVDRFVDSDGRFRSVTLSHPLGKLPQLMRKTGQAIAYRVARNERLLLPFQLQFRQLRPRRTIPLERWRVAGAEVIRGTTINQQSSHQGPAQHLAQIV